MATDTASLMSVLSPNSSLNSALVAAGVSITAPNNQALAYNYLDGIQSNTPTVLNATALALIPTFDGVVNKLSTYLQQHTPGATSPILPAGYLDTSGAVVAPSALSPATFESWNTAYQKEYLQQNGCSYGGSLVIGGGSAAISPAIHVVLSNNVDASNNPIPESQVKVIVMENLTKTSFATMSLADQNLVTGKTFSDGINYFASTIAPSLGLSTNAMLTSSGSQTPAQIIQTAIAGIVADATSNGVPITYNSSTNTVSFITGQTDPTGAAVTQASNSKGQGYLLCYNDVILFTQELQNELTKINNMTVFSVTDITNAKSAVQARYKDVSAFGTVANQVSISNINSINISNSGTGLHDSNDNMDNSQLLTFNVVTTDVAPVDNATTNDPIAQNYDSKGNKVGSTYLATTLPGEKDPVPSGYNESGLEPADYSTSSNQSTISSGYSKLINAETQILGLQNQMNIIASTGVLQNKQLDVPDLIFYLQLYTNLTDEQENAAATEVVNQQNDLLNAYSAMQQLINQVQSAFSGNTDTNAQLDIVGDDKGNDLIKMLTAPVDTSKSDAKDVLTTAQLSILSMFDKGIGGAQNPIEKLFGITRPTFSFFDDANGASFTTKRYTSTSYNAYGTSLSDAVTQINQQTQIMMNNINDLDKEKNEHFDLANNALSKASDIYQAIGNNLNG